MSFGLHQNSEMTGCNILYVPVCVTEKCDPSYGPIFLCRQIDAVDRSEKV